MPPRRALSAWVACESRSWLVPRHIGSILRVYCYDPPQRRNVTMSEQDWLAKGFEEHRTRLRAVAYRMLGSVSEADDAVQEAWLRLSRSETSDIENLGGWLTTVVARVSLDMLRSRASRREEPAGAHPPDHVVSLATGTDPEHE